VRIRVTLQTQGLSCCLRQSAARLQAYRCCIAVLWCRLTSCIVRHRCHWHVTEKTCQVAPGPHSPLWVGCASITTGAAQYNPTANHDQNTPKCRGQGQLLPANKPCCLSDASRWLGPKDEWPQLIVLLLQQSRSPQHVMPGKAQSSVCLQLHTHHTACCQPTTTPRPQGSMPQAEQARPVFRLYMSVVAGCM
jgi:hypothetical protein